VEDAFVEFANKIPFYGTAIVCLDDPTLRRLLPRMTRRVRTYGTSPDADLTASELMHGHFRSRFRLRLLGDDLGEFEVQGAGRHSVLNASAAALAAFELEASEQQVREGLADFSGVDRRFQNRGERAGVTVIDDYGHHPTEIRATLAAARNCDFGRVHVIFQPHRYSRTHSMIEEFAHCFGDCDTLSVVDIYAAGEEAIEGVNSVDLVQRIRAAGHPAAEYCASLGQAVERAIDCAEPGDAVMTLGAGNVGRVADDVLAALGAKVGREVMGSRE
jgi:UDP-N-acetylmuramate--alanine ligase